jgi:hypothetical protein
MAMKVSAIQRARDFVRRRNEQAKNMVVQVRTDAETVGAAAGMAYLRGRFGAEQMQFGDIDVELLAGVPLKLVAYMNVLGKSVSPDLHAISNGILAAYAAQQAMLIGDEHRSQDNAATQGVRGIGPGAVSPIGTAPRSRVAAR